VQIGRYEILDELGRGAMGVVFKGRDPFIGRLVAIKTITAEIADNPEFLERFRREAQAAGGLQHPNIVTIYEMSEFEGTPFIAMEYLEGESLEKKIDGQARIPLVHKLGCLVQTCRALDYAHRRGVIHRDVKPGNIVVTSEGIVKVVDFGIARMVDTSKTQTGMMLGTLSYMAPEQIAGKHADQRCDIWALGVVMYELLTYRRPYDGDNHAALLMTILHEEPRPLREAVPECPQVLEAVVLRALRKAPEQRYQTMEALLVDLEPIWSAMQRDAVQKLMSHGRELMESGRLEEASTVLRKSLSLDTGNTAVKALYDRVNAMLGESARAPEDPKKSTVDQRETLPGAPDLASKSGETGVSTRFDPLSTRVMEPAGPRSTQNNAPVAPSPPPRGGRASETIFVSSLNSVTAGEPAKPRASVQDSAPAKTISARPAGPQGTPPAAVRRDAFAATAPSSGRGAAAYVVAGVVAVLILGAVGYRKLAPNRKPAAEQTAATQPAPQPAPAPIASAAQPEAPAAPAASAPESASPAQPTASIEDQQRHLVDLAHEAADAKDFRAAQARLDEAAKLNGPLNPLIKDLRHEFSDEAHGAELRQLGAREQSLWDRAMKAFAAGEWGSAEKPLREILTLPEVNRHWTEAARYVDETIPERRKADQLWANEQQEIGVMGPEHRINEVKLLDQLLALGGVHQKDARERRDTLMSQFARNGLRKSAGQGSGQGFGQGSQRAGSPDPQLGQLKDELDQAVTQGDAKALQQMQALRPRFKSIVDGGGAQVADARDCLNNLLGRAQKIVGDRLAAEEANSSLNAEYRNAMKHFDQAVATQNAKMLRAQVQPEFEKVLNSNGPRTEEAQRYVSELVPAALKKISR
jgi:serine/threonine protein kinase/ribosomal protein S20